MSLSIFLFVWIDFGKPADDLETLTLEPRESRLEILCLIRIDNIDMK